MQTSAKVETLPNVSQPLRKHSLKAVPGSFLYIYHVIFGKKAHLDLNLLEKVFTVKKKKSGALSFLQWIKCVGAVEQTDV